MALGSISRMVCWTPPRLPLAPCHICSCWYHGELVCLDCHGPSTLDQQNREVHWLQVSGMCGNFFNKWQVSFQMKNYDLGSWKRTLVNDFWGLRFLVPFATQMKFPYQGLALDHVVLYRIAALKSPKSLHRFFIDSSIRYGDHVSEEKQTALTFPIFCTMQERSGLGTWLLQCGLPDPCADLVTDEWTLDEASSNPKVVSAFCWALFSIAKDGAN